MSTDELKAKCRAEAERIADSHMDYQRDAEVVAIAESLQRMYEAGRIAGFAYALAHAWIYSAFDLGYDWPAAWSEVQEKPYLLAGLAALLLLVPLAATSTHTMIRRLGGNWRRLHRASYAVAVLGLLHFWWLTKPGLHTPWPDTAVLGVLLGYRAALYSGLLQRWDGFDGKESMERPT